MFFLLSCVHLSGWNFSSHLLLHSVSLSKSCCNMIWSSLFCMCLTIFVSSANRYISEDVDSGMSFI